MSGRRGGGRRSDRGRGQPSQSPGPALQHSGRGRGAAGASASGGRGRGGVGRGSASGTTGASGVAPVSAPSTASSSRSAAAVPTSSATHGVTAAATGTASTSTAPAQPSKQHASVSSSITALSSEVEQKLKLAPAQLPPASSKAVTFPGRPGFGTIGRKIMVRANHFLVEVKDRDLHHYDVSITPEVTSKKINRDVMMELDHLYRESHLGNRKLAYDGRKSLYSAGSLPFESKEFVVKLVEKDSIGGSASSTRKGRQFKVTIKLASRPDLHHLQEYLAGGKLMRHMKPSKRLMLFLEWGHHSYVTVGRSFYSPVLGKKGELGEGVEYWGGYYQSLRLTQLGFSLNIDVSARSFYEPIFVTEFIGKYLKIRDFSRPLSDQDRAKVKKALKSVRVELAHWNYARSYKITGISNSPIKQLTFLLDDNKTRKSVVEYFVEKHGPIKYPNLPAVQAGSESKPIYFPMELCRIVEGQRYTKRLNERQVSSLLRATCQRPNAREDAVKKMVACNRHLQNEFVRTEFGIQVKEELTMVEARVLPPPKLKYHDTGREAMVDPRLGQWNMIDKKMVNGGRVDSWACVNFSFRVERHLPGEFCKQLIAMCVSKGMQFNPQPIIPLSNCNPSQIEKTLWEIHQKATTRIQVEGKRLQLLIIILPDESGSYGKIKRICETELGIVSQCCQPRQASKLNKQYMENVALKINVKVGGRNTVLNDAIQRNIPLVTDRPTIIIGADVTHPLPGEDSGPSIAAVVASMDWPEVTKYRGLVSAQPSRQEIIQDLYKTVQDPQRGLVHSGMIRELFIAFRRSTGQKPHRIIFYRDGVSEGQFNQVLLYEMDAIRKACISLEDNYLPRVTFVVVQKRHHTRLFPADHNNRSLTDRSGNIQPGTVVDTKICHPIEFDFYLNSHAGIQGTSRPAHYHVLCDENRFSADALQILTNNLCYTYARCTRSVSIVPPAYYAHLAAFRARYYIEGETSDGGSTSGRSRSTNLEVRDLPSIKDNVKDVMFYC